MITNPYEVAARELMKIMLYDNGADYNKMANETEARYKKKYLKLITNACEEFFGKYPQFITDEDFENIAAGELTENQNLYGIYPEYNNLNKALNEYFDVM